MDIECRFGKPIIPSQSIGLFKILITRMHSSRMRTVRLFPYLSACTALGGVPGPGGCTCPGVCHPSGVYLALGGVPGPGGSTWSWVVYLVPRVYLVLGSVPGPRGGVPGPMGYLPRYSPCGQTHVKT